MNKKYWSEFYQMEEPSSFAKFCLPYIPANSTIIDMGCGNGRDSYYFGENGHNVIGIDYAYQPRKVTRNVDFEKISLEEVIRTYRNFDVTYSRFFLHAITKEEVVKFVKWARGLLMVEFRDAGDRPRLYHGHQRTRIEGEWCRELLLKNRFEVLYYLKARNLAKYKSENPLIVRIIAEKPNVPVR